MDDLKKVDINLGLVCNSVCRFCVNGLPGEERKFASLKNLEREIRRYRKKGFRALGFLGGEPTVHPAIIDLVSLARKLGFEHIDIVSNGRKYHERGFVEKLIRNGVTRFYVSIHSHKASIEDYLTGCPGSFRQKIKGLRNLLYFRKKGMIRDRIFLNTVINSRNYRFLKEIMLFYHSMGFTDFRFNFIRPEGRAYANGQSIVPAYSSVMRYIREAVELSRRLKVFLFFEGVPFCLFHRAGIGNFREHIGEFLDGDKEISIRESNRRVQFVMRQRRKDQLKQKVKACGSCLYGNACEGPWKKYIGLYGPGEFCAVPDPRASRPLSARRSRAVSYSLHRRA